MHSLSPKMYLVITHSSGVFIPNQLKPLKDHLVVMMSSKKELENEPLKCYCGTQYPSNSISMVITTVISPVHNRAAYTCKD